MIHLGPREVHLDVQFTRHRGDGTVIGAYPAVDVIIEGVGDWRVQPRSRFAPLVRTAMSGACPGDKLRVTG